MSWGVDIVIDHADGYTTTVEVVSGHTYNLTAMWRKAGVFQSSRDLDGRNAGMLAPILSAALVDAVRHRSAYEELNPANGWGDYHPTRVGAPDGNAAVERMTDRATAGTGTCRPRTPRPHAYDPAALDYGLRPTCRECGGEKAGHIPTPRSEEQR